MKTPVVLIIFKRPHTTEQVFERIREAKPSKLFVIADGARVEKEGEAEKCATTREIIERVDWDCEVIKNYSDINLGCAKRVSTGIDWVFEQVEEAIILEDDCVPHPSFFKFCKELLDKYKYDTRISSISGTNYQLGQKRNNYSYYYSIYNHCWGWATWKRAWQHFDINMKKWEEMKAEKYLDNILLTSQSVKYWSEIFQSTYKKPCDTVWDFQWTFACYIQNTLGIIPNVNLVSNIGFGADSTHFQSKKKNKFENMPTEQIEFPLKHPDFVICDRKADNFTQKNLFRQSKKQQIIKIFHRYYNNL